jgi:4-hydroxy-2-oxoheptanedioate aldolase
VKNGLKRRLSEGELLFGAWIGTGSATNVEIMAHLGFDFLIIDLEHGQGELGELLAMLRVAAASPAAAVVRVPWNDQVLLKRVLDLGAENIMIPQIESVREAQEAVAACRYPPLGRRGYAAPNVRASGYGRNPNYLAEANAELLLILQIESENAVRSAAAIAAVDGLDVPFLGVNDMAGSIGLLERLDQHPVRVLATEAAAGMAATGKPMGTVPSAGASLADLVAAGYRFLPMASDVGLLRDGALEALRAAATLRPGAGARPAAATGAPTYG